MINILKTRGETLLPSREKVKEEEEGGGVGVKTSGSRVGGPELCV